MKYMNKVCDFVTVELPGSTINVPRAGKQDDSSASVSYDEDTDDSDSDDDSESASESSDDNASPVNSRKRGKSAKKKKIGQKLTRRVTRPGQKG